MSTEPRSGPPGGDAAESAGPADPLDARARNRGVLLLAVVAAAVLVLDVIVKTIAVATLEGKPPVELAGGALYLTVLRNPGAAWSLATGYTWVLTLVAVLVVVVIVRIARRLASAGWALGLGLVLGGALGNLGDRFFRAPGPLRGHVVDMFSLFAPDGSVWPVFNIADSGIVCGGILLVLMALRGIEIDGSRGGEPGSAGNAGSADNTGKAGSADNTDRADDTDSGEAGRG
ncbi:signal peptidase II [Pseudonocardia phyllosphaerae]|uniref:signal peptidase II n=1 Tax=Pseudonocardia phyllosphaerae TaxID=3390502 RepID=UPI003978F830